MEAPKCPICHQVMTIPIFQCQSGHSICFSCTKKLQPAICPLCCQVIRNWQLEDIVTSSGVTCPNKNAGCIMRISPNQIEEHLKECIFRTIDCPLAQACGTCSWKGHRKNLAMHFKEHHPQNYINQSGTNYVEISIDNVSTLRSCRYLYLIHRQKQFFILTFKIDTTQNLAYWLVQFMGSKTVAQQKIYEIRVTSQIRENCKVIFVDYCLSDSLEANDIFQQAKCATMPLLMLSNFITNFKVMFTCSIKMAEAKSGPIKEQKVPHSNSSRGSRSQSCSRGNITSNKSKPNIF